MDRQFLNELARHQAWADAQHWTALRSNPSLLDDSELRERLNHMTQACLMLTTLARGGTPDLAGLKKQQPTDVLESAMNDANEELRNAIDSLDLAQSVSLPRGPKGPFEAPAGVLLLQALMHAQHHRGQNAARMRTLGVTPPMTDFVFWYALGQP
jgi:uncharacterized damage-inducible protein DinB